MFDRLRSSFSLSIIGLEGVSLKETAMLFLTKYTLYIDTYMREWNVLITNWASGVFAVVAKALFISVGVLKVLYRIGKQKLPASLYARRRFPV